jgi:hypothetical protein
MGPARCFFLKLLIADLWILKFLLLLQAKRSQNPAITKFRKYNCYFGTLRFLLLLKVQQSQNPAITKFRNTHNVGHSRLPPHDSTCYWHHSSLCSGPCIFCHQWNGSSGWQRCGLLLPSYSSPSYLSCPALLFSVRSYPV